MSEYTDSDNDKRVKPVRVIIAITAMVGLFYVGYSFGAMHGATAAVPEGEGHIVGQDIRYEGVEDDIDFRQYWDVWNVIKASFLNKPVSEKDLFYGSLRGMVDALDDPYSLFLDPEEAQVFDQDLNGTFFGIGAEIGEKDGVVTVMSPLQGAPAEQAGILAGDLIITVDGTETYGMTVGEVVNLIRGEEGTDVVLGIFRDDFEEVTDITITRQEIQIDSVRLEIRDDNIAVISVYIFNEETTGLFQEAIDEILENNVQNIVLDLRNNPGGLLTEAINLAGFWIDGSPVVKQRVGDEIKVYSAAGIARLEGIQTVVLVNQGSASASEILAGALQDYDVATIVGEQTFGKGSVQDYQVFPDGSALKITIAEWLTPEGRSINETGITPDVIVEYTTEDYNEERTPQIDTAISILEAE
jgi:carboxyl-terminal processing protease